MSRNNEHLAEFIMLANVVRDAATMLEKAYKRAVTEGAPVFEDPECDHIVSRALTAAQNVGAMADAARRDEKEVYFRKHGGEAASMRWLRDCALNCNNAVDLSRFKRYIRVHAEEFNISGDHVRWVMTLTLLSIQEL